MSQRAYATHRGVSHMAVQRAIRSGRLKRSINDGGQISDPALADAEWDANTDVAKVPHAVQTTRAAAAAAANPGEVGPPAAVLGASLNENNAAKIYWQARKAELDFREAAGELVPAAGVRAELEGVFRSCRTRLLGIPSRARQLLPGLSVADVGVLENLVREALEGLARGEVG